MMLQVPRKLWLALAMFPGAAFALGLGEVRNVSPLNQPLAAEIPILSAAPDELDSLRASIASREEFARLGIDRPGFLSTVSIKVVKGKGGEPFLQLHSAERITEPFVTLLVEAGWNRGRLVREYTLLLDPPVYRDASARVTAPVAPVVAPPAVSAPVVRPAAAPAAAESSAAAAPSAPAGELAYGSTYRVRSSDSALRIARKLGATSRGEVDQTMVALFQQNPSAFSGNINRLRAGASMRLPTRDEVAAIPVAAARQEVHDQYAAARAEAEARANAASAPAAEEVAAPPAPAPSVAAPSPAPAAGRLRLVTPGAGSGVAPATAPAVATKPGPASAPAADRVQQLESELEEARRLLQLQNEQLAKLQQAGAAPPPSAPAAAPIEATPAPAAARPAAKPAAAPVVEEESLVDRLGGLPTLLLGGAFLLLAGGLGYGFVRRRREAAADEFAVEEPSTASTGEDFFQTTGSLPAPVRPSPSHMEVMERPVTESAPPVVRPRPAARNTDDTLSGESAIDLDKADALTEANWHVAYGLYDQAADTLLAALRRTPERRDLRVKLAEVYFAWGKADRFLEVARELGRSRVAGDAAEWDNLVIMGRQLAPQDPLFAGAPPKLARTSVDIDLEGGQNRVDVELFSTPDASLPGDDVLDFDLEGALAASAGETGTQLQPVWRGDSPTIEQPALQLHEPTLRQKVDSAVLEAASRSAGSASAPTTLDATAEMSLDELNLDLQLDLGDADQGAGLDFPELSPLEDTVQPGDITSTHAMAQLPDPAPTETVLMGELTMASVEPVTLSEVGTKLDLARAYMDMGDPEGARSILLEVVSEGSAGQQQEAKRLLGSLPG